MAYILPLASSRNNNNKTTTGDCASQHRTKVPFHARVGDTYNEPSSLQLSLLS
jgi:hypothetical protein